MFCITQISQEQFGPVPFPVCKSVIWKNKMTSQNQSLHNHRNKHWDQPDFTLLHDQWHPVLNLPKTKLDLHSLGHLRGEFEQRAATLFQNSESSLQLRAKSSRCSVFHWLGKPCCGYKQASPRELGETSTTDLGLFCLRSLVQSSFYPLTSPQWVTDQSRWKNLINRVPLEGFRTQVLLLCTFNY